MDPRDIEVVSTIGKAGSLARAGRLLGISTAAVSKRLISLEAALGTRLFDRTTRRLTPTSEGAYLIHEGRRLLVELEDLQTRLSGKASSAAGHLRVLSSLGFGREVVAPMLSDFKLLYPDCTVDLTLSQGFSEEFKAFDLAITIGQNPTKSFISKILAPNRRLLVASPKYLERYGAPQHPAELRHQRCLVMNETSEDPTTWQLSSPRQVETVRVAPHMTTNDGAVLVGWVLAGHGIALRSDWTVRAHLASGELIRVLPDYYVQADICAVWPRSRHTPARVTLLTEYLSERLIASCN